MYILDMKTVVPKKRLRVKKLLKVTVVLRIVICENQVILTCALFKNRIVTVQYTVLNTVYNTVHNTVPVQYTVLLGGPSPDPPITR